MAAANLHDDLKLSSSSSNSSRSDSDSSSDGEIRDEEKAVKKKAKNIKTETEEGEMDEAVKRFCEAKLKEVKSVLGVELETLITMRAHAEEARETAKKAEGGVAKTLKKISELQREKARLQVPNITCSNLFYSQSGPSCYKPGRRGNQDREEDKRKSKSDGGWLKTCIYSAEVMFLNINVK